MHDRGDGEGEEAEGDRAGVGVVEDVGRDAGAAGGAGVADRTEVDDVALAVLKDEVLRCEPVDGARASGQEDRRLVGVSDEGQLAGEALEVRLRVRLVLNVDEAGGVAEVSVGADRAADFRRVGQSAQPGDRLGVERGLVARNGFGGEVDEERGIAASRDGVIVIAGQDRAAARADACERFARQRTVSDDVPEADELPCAVPCGVRQHAIECVEVGVNVGKDGVDHGVTSPVWRSSPAASG